MGEVIVTEAPVEASEVMLQIKESKAERRKHVGYNKKQVRNINEIIEKDHKTSKDGRKRVSTEEEAKKRKSKRWEGKTQDDAIHTPTNIVEAAHVSGKEDDQKEPAADRDIEMEQQQMMNRVFNCPNLYSALSPSPPWFRWCRWWCQTRMVASLWSSCLSSLCPRTSSTPNPLPSHAHPH